jgi:hypothetical protein
MLRDFFVFLRDAAPTESLLFFSSFLASALCDAVRAFAAQSAFSAEADHASVNARESFAYSAKSSSSRGEYDSKSLGS